MRFWVIRPLTTGVDQGTAFVGAKGDDTFSALATATFQALDSLDGGAGAGDTLNVADNTAAVATAGINVKNIEIANFASKSTVTADTTAWTGLTTLNVVSDTGASSVTAAATTAVTVSAHTAGTLAVTGGLSQKVTATGGNTTLSGSVGAVALTQTAQAANSLKVDGGVNVSVTATGATTGTLTIGSVAVPTGTVTASVTSAAAGSSSMGEIKVTGGTTVAVTQTAGNAVTTTDTMGKVTVTGSAATTSVSVINSAAATAGAKVAGVTDNEIVVVGLGATAVVDTIASITASGYTTLTATKTNALASLSLSNGSGNVTIDNNFTSTVAKTLGLTLNGVTGGTISDGNVYTTLNVTTTGANSTLADINDIALTALTLAGTKVLTLTLATGMSKLATVNVSGSAGLVATLTGATVTGVDASGTSGNNIVSIDATKATFAGGTGNDTVTLTTAIPLKAISGGAGVDVLVLDAATAATASLDAVFAGKVTGFESLTLTSLTNQTIDLTVLGGYTNVATSGGNGATLNTFASGGTLTLTGAGTAYTVANPSFTLGTADVLNLKLTDASASGVSFASTGITAASVETINITVTDAQTTPTGTFLDAVTLLGNSAKTISVSGNAGLTLTALDTAATSVDASGITLGGFAWTSGALAAAAVVKGSVAGTNVVDLSLAVAAATTYTGGTGSDSVTVVNAKNNVINLGSGTSANTVTSGAATGNNTVTSTSTGTDSVTLGSGNNTVSLGDGANNFTASTGNNTYTGGAGVDTVVVTTGGNTISVGAGDDSVSIGGSTQLNTVDVGTGTDTVILTGTQSAAGFYTTITGMSAGDLISLDLVSAGAATAGALGAKITLGGVVSFANYLDAAAVSTTGATNAVLKWFQYGGTTFLVSDNSATTTFADGVDTVISLIGLVDLSASTTTTAHIVTLV